MLLNIKDDKNKPKYGIIQIIIPLFYVLIFFKYYLGDDYDSLQKVITSTYVIIGFCITLFMLTKLKTNSSAFIIIISLLFIAQFISVFSINYRFEDNALVFCYFGIALMPIYYKLNYKIFKVLDYSLILFFILSIFNEVDPNEMFSVSRNFISVLLLIGLGYHIISAYQNNRKLSFILFFLSFIVSIWATGRGGIIVFTLLLLCFPFIQKIKTIYKIILIIFVIIALAGIYFYFYDLLFEYGLGRFDDMGLEGDRSTMNSEYLSHTISSIFNLLFGTPLPEINSIVDVDLNPHNSFIRLHVYYGFFGFLIVIFSLIYSLRKYLKSKNILFALLLVSILIRSFVDSIAFHGPLDPLIYFLIFNSMITFKDNFN